MDLSALIAVFVVGAVCGFPLGQWWAEMTRAKRDMQRMWESRSQYRRRNR